MSSSTIALSTCAPRSNASTRPWVNASAASACSSIVTSARSFPPSFPFVLLACSGVLSSIAAAIAAAASTRRRLLARTARRRHGGLDDAPAPDFDGWAPSGRLRPWPCGAEPAPARLLVGSAAAPPPLLPDRERLGPIRRRAALTGASAARCAAGARLASPARSASPGPGSAPLPPLNRPNKPGLAARRSPRTRLRPRRPRARRARRRAPPPRCDRLSLPTPSRTRLVSDSCTDGARPLT